MNRRMELAKAYEKALFAGDRDAVGELFHDDIMYWVAGAPPIGGEWHGRERVLDALWNREPGLGPADWEGGDVWRDWYDAEDRVIVEIRERWWLKSHPKDVMDQRTCVIIRFHGDKIAEMRDHTDTHIYEEFVLRHRTELPKFKRHRDVRG
jgi:ketosteroid isomerase-like protein